MSFFRELPIHHMRRVPVTATKSPVSSAWKLFHYSRRLISTTPSYAASKIDNDCKTKLCFMFPGMGSQYSGMCKDLATDFKYIRTFLEECNESLGFSITDIMWNSDPKQLQQAAFAGTSIFIHSMCIWRILQKEYEIEKVLTDRNCTVIGHSAGEYSALRVANVFNTFADALNIVNFYAKCMQRCSTNEQAMYAVIAEDIDVELLQHTVNQHNVDVANINTSNQIIISGLKAKIDAAVRAFDDYTDSNYKVKGKYLETGGAYHSRFMKPMADILKDVFRFVPLNKELKCDLYLNVIGDKYDRNTHDDIASIMAQQLYDQVYWHQCIKNYFAANEEESGSGTEYNFIEIGPKTVLQNMVKYICKYHKYDADDRKRINVMSIGSSKGIGLMKGIL